MPALNAGQTLEDIVEAINRDVVDEIVLVDDKSSDNTVELARRLNIRVIWHPHNVGYGGNQKTCYLDALQRDPDIVVMLHPDGQYEASLIPDLIRPIVEGRADLVLGSRLAEPGAALAGGMPRSKYLANRALTALENLALGTRLSEMHTGYLHPALAPPPRQHPLPRSLPPARPRRRPGVRHGPRRALPRRSLDGRRRHRPRRAGRAGPAGRARRPAEDALRRGELPRRGVPPRRGTRARPRARRRRVRPAGAPGWHGGAVDTEPAHVPAARRDHRPLPRDRVRPGPAPCPVRAPLRSGGDPRPVRFRPLHGVLPAGA